MDQDFPLMMDPTQLHQRYISSLRDLKIFAVIKAYLIDIWTRLDNNYCSIL